MPRLRTVIEVRLRLVIARLRLVLKRFSSLTPIGKGLLYRAQGELREDTFKRLGEVFPCVLQSLKRLFECFRLR